MRSSIVVRIWNDLVLNLGKLALCVLHPLLLVLLLLVVKNVWHLHASDFRPFRAGLDRRDAESVFFQFALGFDLYWLSFHVFNAQLLLQPILVRKFVVL